MKVQIAIMEAACNLCPIEGGSKPVSRPGATTLVSQNGRGPLWDASKDGPEAIIERDDSLTALATLAGVNLDSVFANVRPREAQQVAEAQTGMSRQIDRVSYLGRAGAFRGTSLKLL